jgi:hypothetical protein
MKTYETETVRRARFVRRLVATGAFAAGVLFLVVALFVKVIEPAFGTVAQALSVQR